MADSKDELIERYIAHIRIFVDTGSPTVFGRLEGLKEAAEILGYTQAVAEMERLTNENHEAMARWTA